MRNSFNQNERNKELEKNILSVELTQKVSAALVHYVYSQTYLGMFAFTFCATIIFIGLFSKSNTLLFFWYGLTMSVGLLRVLLVVMYEREKFPIERSEFWKKLYIIGAMLGGLTWGLAALLLFPQATELQKTLLVLMMAGVTAGAIPLTSAMPPAAILFLVCSLTPYIISIFLLHNYIYFIFDIAVAIYLCYMILLSMKAYNLVKNSILLRFENDVLLDNLFNAKEELEVSNRLLEQAATHDPLTQVANRNLFQLHLDKAIERARKNETRLALLYIDLDRYKFVNDIYGHHVGDQVLITTVDRLAKFFGTSDIIARLGGDELTVILENVVNEEDVASMAEQLCKLIATPFRVNTVGLKITASIGISFYPKDGDDARELLWFADKSMYYVKEHGGNDYHFTEETSKVND